MDAHTVTILHVLRELKAVAITSAVVTNPPCEGACRSEIPQGVGVTFHQCGCRTNEGVALE